TANFVQFLVKLIYARLNRADADIVVRVDSPQATQFRLRRNQLPLETSGGFDHCFPLLGNINRRIFAGKVTEISSGQIEIRLYTLEPSFEENAFAARR